MKTEESQEAARKITNLATRKRPYKSDEVIEIESDKDDDTTEEQVVVTAKKAKKALKKKGKKGKKGKQMKKNNKDVQNIGNDNINSKQKNTGAFGNDPDTSMEDYLLGKSFDDDEEENIDELPEEQEDTTVQTTEQTEEPREEEDVKPNLLTLARSLGGLNSHVGINQEIPNRVHQYVQTLPCDKLTALNKMGKHRSSSGYFVSCMSEEITQYYLDSVWAWSKGNQTNKMPGGKVMYARARTDNSWSEPMYDCTFHTYCRNLKIKFHTKEELTEHIMYGHKDQPNYSLERRDQTTYHKPIEKQRMSTLAAYKDRSHKSLVPQNTTLKCSSTSSKTVQLRTEQGQHSFSRSTDKSPNKSSNSLSRDSSPTSPTSPQKITVTMSPRSKSKFTTKSSAQLDCPVCNETFSTQKDLYSHMQTSHTASMVENSNVGRPKTRAVEDRRLAKLPSFITDNEGRLQFTDDDGNVKPESNFLSTKDLIETVYPCPVCRAIFYHDFELEAHIEAKHSTPVLVESEKTNLNDPSAPIDLDEEETSEEEMDEIKIGTCFQGLIDILGDFFFLTSQDFVP